MGAAELATDDTMERLKRIGQEEPNFRFVPTKREEILLKDPNLLRIIDLQFDKRVVGEELNRRAIFLNACGAWVKNAGFASFNLCINSNSGAGKDYVCKSVLKLLPPGLFIHRTRISPTAFTYWHNSKFEPEWTWDGKVLLLSDISNGVLNSDVFKVMVSDGTHSTVVINQQAVDIHINGKPIIFITTASANPNSEMLRRFPFLELDESVGQTRRIKQREAEYASEGINLNYDPLVISALSKLHRVNVRIPYSMNLVEFFPEDHIIMRTHFQRLLDTIKASAALHQYQREVDQEGFVIATPGDYEEATIALRATTSNVRMIPLTKKQKMLLDVAQRKGEFSVSEIEPQVPFLAQSKLYENLSVLQELGFLTSESREVDGKKRPVRYYCYVELTQFDIPAWKDIESCRKKGIKGLGGNEGIPGNEGITPSLAINSPYSLNSRPKLPTDWPKWDDYVIVLLPCCKCGGERCNRGPDNKPYCRLCGDWSNKIEEEVI